jgi:hypothetical protein
MLLVSDSFGAVLFGRFQNDADDDAGGGIQSLLLFIYFLMITETESRRHVIIQFASLLFDNFSIMSDFDRNVKMVLFINDQQQNPFF